MRFKVNADAQWDSRLAIPQDRFIEIRDAMVDFIGQDLLDHHTKTLLEKPRYQPGGEGDIAKRVRWDCYWAVRKHIVDPIDLTDAQMDSAFRRIVIEA